MTTAISLEKVGKTFHRGKVLHRDLKSTLAAWWQPAVRQETFAALTDIDLQVPQGDVIGLIGSNGAGKSTLLKLLSRITFPTTGRIRICGTLSSMLEVGTGFHPELTGRENIYLNAAIIGMRRSEVHRKLDSIVTFADLEEFLDTPVKHYSSGMYVRLAFAVAAHLEPDILLVDEVLAVGDQAFRRKCFDKLKEVSTLGRTIILVSHQMNYLRELCTRGVWVHQGAVRFDGAIDAAIQAYGESALAPDGLSLRHRKDRGGSGLVQVTHLALEDEKGTALPNVFAGKPLSVAIDLEHPAAFQGQPVEITLAFTDIYGQVVMTAGNAISGQSISLAGQRTTWRCHFMKLPLNAQPYSIRVTVYAGRILADQVSDAMSFEVLPGPYYPTHRLPAANQGFLAEYSWMPGPP